MVHLFVFIFFLPIPVWFGRQIYRSSVTEWNTEADVSRLDPSVLVSFAVPSPSVIVRDMSFGSLPSVDEETVLNGPPTEVADSGAFYLPSPICCGVTQRPPLFTPCHDVTQRLPLLHPTLFLAGFPCSKTGGVCVRDTFPCASAIRILPLAPVSPHRTALHRPRPALKCRDVPVAAVVN